MPTSWEAMSVANLRAVAKRYKALHSLGNIHKQPKATLIETLGKFMEWKDNKLYTKKEHGGKEVDTYLEPKQPKQPKKAEQPKQKKAEKADMFDKDAKKKSVKKAISQAKSASEDAKKISPPSQNEVDRAKLRQSSALQYQVGTKGRKQAKSAQEDAKSIAPPKMEKEPQVKKKWRDLSDKEREKMDELEQDLFYAVLEAKGINTFGKSDEYLDKVSDKYHPFAEALMEKWYNKGGEAFAIKETKDFISRYS
jgi:hypothetical protein